MENVHVGKFLAAIKREAAQHKKALRSETESYISDEMIRAENDILLEIYRMIQNRISYLRGDIGREHSGRQLAEKRELFKARDAIMADVFAEAARRLKEYAATPEYLSHLKTGMTKCLAVLGGGTGDGELTVYLCERDLIHAEALKFPGYTIEFAPDNSIEIGGLRMRKKGSATLIDESLDTKLKGQREWFATNSGLNLAE